MGMRVRMAGHAACEFWKYFVQQNLFPFRHSRRERETRIKSSRVAFRDGLDECRFVNVSIGSGDDAYYKVGRCVPLLKN